MRHGGGGGGGGTMTGYNNGYANNTGSYDTNLF
jgi:hypothetical protein